MIELNFGRWYRFKHWLAHKMNRCGWLCSHCYYEAAEWIDE